jgi:uncharacterized protein YkwD
MHGVDPWAHSAPIYAEPPPYEDPTRYERPPVYRGPPGYGPPDDLDYEFAEGSVAGRRMGPLAVTGMIAAIFISIGLALTLLFSTFSGAPKAKSAPNLPGVLDSSGAGSLAPQPAPVVPTESADPTPSAEPSARPTTPPPAAGNAGVENAVVALVNAERRKARCDPVRVDSRLRDAARQHSADMATGGFLSSKGSDGSSANDRMRAAGFDDPLSENVAQGFRSANDVMTAWVRSGRDRRHIVDCDARSIGVGIAVSDGGTAYWTQDFGR